MSTGRVATVRHVKSWYAQRIGVSRIPDTLSRQMDGDLRETIAG